jgi:L-serine/L-threonine ammonia-lyase
MFRPTPVIKHLSLLNGLNVWFKPEFLQPSGSFKDRGIGRLIKSAVKKNGYISKIVSSSGGNAGNAAATIGQHLGISVEVHCPESTLPHVVQKLKNRSATVHVGGENWDAADKRAQEACKVDKNALYVSPFDHSEIWAGYITIVEELHEQLHAGGDPAPDLIICSVGGGGLLRGLQLGLEQLRKSRQTLLDPAWEKTQLLGVETEGAASFASGMSYLTIPCIQSCIINMTHRSAPRG